MISLNVIPDVEIDFIPNKSIKQILGISESTRKRDFTLLRLIFGIKDERILGLSLSQFCLYQRFREIQKIAGRDKAISSIIETLEKSQ